ncbi:hypothetical protein [Sorangium sp. So ce513]|jgi:hypothetical protein|uniref:hypothetical protein n=1 Tax=Sorangium sp. So ce513 TaxID=3133315 RepID=UPI003F5E39EF
MILYRPVGLEELVLIHKTGLRTFPPRLPEQPIFYPVLNQDYATQIAHNWNTKSGSLAGYVTEFDLDDAYAKSLPVRQVGANQHRELWIPAEKLEEFNGYIHDQVRIVAAYFAPTFSGLIPGAFALRGKNARTQLEALGGIYKYSLMDFHGEIAANNEAVFAHYPYWEKILGSEGAVQGIDTKTLLPAIQQVWSSAFPEVPLGVQPSRTKRPSRSGAT